MKLSVDEILKDCPEVLLPLYPKICERVELYQDTPDDLKNELEPLIILIEGSRGSGKSEFCQRACIAGIHDGYFRNIKYSTITEDGLNGSKDAIERLAPESIATGKNTSKFEPMHRYIDVGRIDFDFFGKADIKNEQKKYDMLICEEVEKWDRKQGIAALETEIRHCAVIILISNNPPEAVKEFCRVHNAIMLECHYWDNKALPQHIRDAYDKARLENPSYFHRYIMCNDETPNPRWFDSTHIENMFNRLESPNLSDIIYGNISVDVGGGTGGDESCIVLIRQSKWKHIFIEIIGKYQLEASPLAFEVAKQRSMKMVSEEVWDAQGLGLSVMQTRAPDNNQRRALGVIPFTNDSSHDAKYFNNRSEAYGLWQEMLAKNMCHYCGDPIYIQEIKNEMNAQMFAPTNISKGQLRIAEKKEIKKLLQGESPNISDAIAMGVWRAIKRPLNTNSPSLMDVKISGAPSL